MGVRETDPLSQLSLPPGFRFYPTDEELLVQYLCRKVAGHQFSLQIIGDVDLYKFDPWMLPSKAMFGEKEWYFFSPRDRKYPNGSRPNRVAGSGYWKATGTDKVIMTEGRRVGIKKSLVFYIGKAPKGTKTNWIMHEYRLSEPHRMSGSAKMDEWVLCRIYKKNSSAATAIANARASEHSPVASEELTSSPINDMLKSLPEMDDQFFALPGMDSMLASQQQDDKQTLQSILGSSNFEWSTLADLNMGPSFNDPIGLNQNQNPSQLQANNVNVDGMYAAPHALEKLKLEADIDQANEENAMMNINSGFYYSNTDFLEPGYPNPVDLYGIRYPNLFAGYGFRQ